MVGNPNVELGHLVGLETCDRLVDVREKRMERRCGDGVCSCARVSTVPNGLTVGVKTSNPRPLSMPATSRKYSILTTRASSTPKPGKPWARTIRIACLRQIIGA